jgi:hypothetical protein
VPPCSHLSVEHDLHYLVEKTILTPASHAPVSPGPLLHQPLTAILQHPEARARLNNRAAVFGLVALDCHAHRSRHDTSVEFDAKVQGFHGD